MSMPMLTEFLESRHVDFDLLTHPRAYTAQQTAASAHLRGRQVAKTVMVAVDGRIAMCVLPATDRLDLRRLQAVTGARQVAICSEEEFAGMFPACEPGAMPPFGNLFDMDVYLDDGLAEDDEIAFNAGTHTELIRMSYSDFEELVNPRVARLTV